MLTRKSSSNNKGRKKRMTHMHQQQFSTSATAYALGLHAAEVVAAELNEVQRTSDLDPSLL